MGPDAFSLWEAILSLVLATVVLTGIIRLWISLGEGATQLDARSEEMVMCESVRRVVSTDAHAAVRTGIVWGSLWMTLADGTTYRYVLNHNGQYVRDRNGGGSAVLAVGIKSAFIATYPGAISLTVTAFGGMTRTMQIATLSGFQR